MSDQTDRPLPPTIVALMIGELAYMAGLNRISTAIVEHAVGVWRETPGSVLVCESAPMTAAAVRMGVAEHDVVTALPQSAGHITRLVALWLAASPYAGRPARLVTHAMHARRAVRIFEKAGIAATAIGLDLPFDPHDRDWKLRSAGVFRAYNLAAHLHGICRGWM